MIFKVKTGWAKPGVSSSKKGRRYVVDISYLEGGQELLEKVAPLWMSLNEHHQNTSKHFSRHFQIKR